jgi:hypothetical protein
LSRRLGPHVPPAVRSVLDDAPERQIGLTILVVTVGEGEYPHVAMVSVGELVVIAQARLALSLWPGSTCATNLSREGRATLALVAGGVAYSLSCRNAGEQELRSDPHPPTRAFDLHVAESIEDSAPYADLLAGVTYRLHDPEAALARWRSTRAALEASFGTEDA